MISAVLDPGVLVSAFIGPPGSVPDRIVRAWRAGQIELVVSPALLDELSDVLGRPKFAHATRDGRAVDFVNALRRRGRTVSDPPATDPITRDPKDDYLVRLARAATPTALVSGDHHLHETDLGDINVLTPRAFIDLVDRPQAE